MCLGHSGVPDPIVQAQLKARMEWSFGGCHKWEDNVVKTTINHPYVDGFDMFMPPICGDLGDD